MTNRSKCERLFLLLVPISLAVCFVDTIVAKLVSFDVYDTASRFWVLNFSIISLIITSHLAASTAIWRKSVYPRTLVKLALLSLGTTVAWFLIAFMLLFMLALSPGASDVRKALDITTMTLGLPFKLSDGIKDVASLIYVFLIFFSSLFLLSLLPNLLCKFKRASEAAHG